MARRALACASSFLLATILAAPAFAEEREPVRVGTLLVPGPGGTLLAALITIFYRAPAPQVSRMPTTWTGPPPGSPRATVATVWQVRF